MKQTAGYGLNLFEGSDRLRTGPVNENTEKLEAALLEAIGELSATIETKVRIETGSYAGTGTYGSDNPCSLTFGFAPKVVIVVHGAGGGDCSGGPIVIMNGTVRYVVGDNAAGMTTWSGGNTVSWRINTDAGDQLNRSNHTYFYAAIA